MSAGGAVLRVALVIAGGVAAAGCGGKSSGGAGAPSTSVATPAAEPSPAALRPVSGPKLPPRLRAAAGAFRRQVHAPGARLRVLYGKQSVVEALVAGPTSGDVGPAVYLVTLEGRIDFRGALAPEAGDRRVTGRFAYAVYDATSFQQLELGVAPRPPSGLD